MTPTNLVNMYLFTRMLDCLIALLTRQYVQLDTTQHAKGALAEALKE